MNISFTGKRILVTGAGRGIGRKLALHLSKYGGQVIALSKTQKNLETLRAEDSRIHITCVDLTDWNNTRKAVESVLPIDLLVNNAAVTLTNSFFDATQEEFDLTFAVNVKAIVNISQVVAKSMVERKVAGSIVNISSKVSQAAYKTYSIYGASKAAVDILSKTMALELGPHNIRVNTINPTATLSERGRLGWAEPEKAHTLLSKIPLGRFVEMSEVIDAVVFLLSDRSSMITGVTLPVDGGFLAT